MVSRPAEIPCADLDAAVAFLTGNLGFRIDMVFPADRPTAVELSGFGVSLRLVSSAGPVREPVSAHPSLGVTRFGRDRNWHVGRAGMQYRDLIPGRLGGWTVASHIRIADEGPVPDYVHYHEIRFQMIYCYRGWVRVVYEDQGEPFVMNAGDCVLQPPGIRHRVLGSSAGLEVIEVGCPAEHETWADHELTLPTGSVRSDRDFDGQRFHRHVAQDAGWEASDREGFLSRDLGIGEATREVATARVLRVARGPAGVSSNPSDRQRFLFVLEGRAALRTAGVPDIEIESGDSMVVLPSVAFDWIDCSPDLECLEVSLPRKASP